MCVIERRFNAAALWCAVASGLSALGMMHSYRFTAADTVVSLTPAWPWAAAYLAMAAIFLSARWLTVAGEGH